MKCFIFWFTFNLKLFLEFQNLKNVNKNCNFLKAPKTPLTNHFNISPYDTDILYFQVVSVFLAVLATLTCIVACIAAVLHFVKLTGLECTPAHVRNATCACRLRTSIASPSEPVLRYTDLNCPEVEGIFTVLLIFSSACNAIGAFVAGLYCYLHWSTRDKGPKYVKVRTSISALNSRPIYNPNLGRR